MNTITFKTSGWVCGFPHTHEVEDDNISKDVVVLCDICPICGYITEEEKFRGEGNPIFLGIYESIEETHKSKYHGNIPYGKKIKDKEIINYVENTYFNFE